MTTGATGQLGLALPVQGELSGTWGDTVNNGITQYTNIAIAATLTLTNDGAVTLANTTGDASASNITSSLTGAGTVTAQFAIVKITGTLTTTKVVTAPSYSKTYVVVNAATGGTVTFKASGQTGVSIAVGESAWVYYNGTDYVKIAGTTSGSAGGSNTQVQYNSSGSLAGSSNLTFDGTNLTLGGGTANGVTYLNGSKVLTSGSALTFDGTNLATTGNMTVNGANGYNVQVSGGNAYRMYATTNDLVFRSVTAGSDVMTLTYGGNVGIGTSSPAQKLDVQSASSPTIRIRNTANALGNYSQLLLETNNSFSGVGDAYLRAISMNAGNSSTSLAFGVNADGGGAPYEAMRLDSAGNLGLGVTPSAWSAYKGLQITGGASFVSYATAAEIWANGYYNGTNSLYVSNGYASRYQQTSGQHIWYTAASGTAGNAISFTQAMTLTSDSHLQAGTTSNLGGITVKAPNAGATGSQIGLAIIGRDTYNDSAINFFASDASTLKQQFFNNNSANDLNIWNSSNGATIFATNNGERARISAAGGFSVGTTADPGAGAIYATGNITAYYSSDIKFKENVRDIPDALATVNAIGGKLFDWTDEYIESKGGADGYFVQKADFGVVAQDVQKVFPIAVRTRPDGSLAVDYEKLGALAFAALTELTKRVEALEAK